MKNKLTYNLPLLMAFFFSSIGASGMPDILVNAIQTTNLITSPTVGSCQLFPENNYWNTPIDELPVHSFSSSWINAIGRTEGFHMDFGSGTWDGGPIGIPFNILDGSLTTKYTVDFYYPDESDPGPYPISANPKIEWGSDHHILVVDTEDCTLYEIYDASKSGGQWSGGSGAIWDLNSNILRPDTWTAADAAGLPILPGLVRYDEVLAGEINHALRFTTNCTADYYVWPARHVAQSGSCSTPPPFGARFRLKENYDITGFSPQAQVILQAMKTYGIILADNGSPWYVSGAPDENWDNDMLHELDNLTGNEFEAVDTSSLIVDADSGETPYHSWPEVNNIIRANVNPTNSTSVNFIVTFSENVTDVDLNDFILATSGVSGVTVSGVSGSGSIYTVTVNTGNNDGTIRLDVIDDDSIVDQDFNPLGDVGAGNGNFASGESYVIDKTMPAISSITRANSNPTSKTSINFLVTFSESVAGVDPSDFSLNTTEVAGAAVSSVSGSGTTRTVKVSTGSGDGMIRLDAIDNDSILDLASNPLNSGFTTGETYTIDKPNLPAPSLRSPRTSTVSNDTTPIFWWTSVRGGATYEIEVAMVNTFIPILDSDVVSGLSHTVPVPLADGEYFWHVRAYNTSNQFGAWSSTRTFTIDNTGPSAPVLSLPGNSSSSNRTPTFKWGSVPTAVLYKFQYDNNVDFSSPTYTVTTRSSFRRPPAMKIGNYYWRVRAKDAVGNWGTWSAPRIINIIGP